MRIQDLRFVASAVFLSALIGVSSAAGCTANQVDGFDETSNATDIDPHEEENVAEAANAATSTDIRWAIQHGAAAAACAAASPEGDSPWGHIVIPQPNGGTCAGACVANTGGKYTGCRTTIAVGWIRMNQATGYDNMLAKNYRYSCNTSAPGGDEVFGWGIDSNAQTAYCCCYG